MTRLINNMFLFEMKTFKVVRKCCYYGNRILPWRIKPDCSNKLVSLTEYREDELYDKGDKTKLIKINQ